MIVSKQPLRVLWSVILYFIAMHLVYRSEIAANFSYMGLSFNPDVDLATLIVPLVMCLLPLVFLRLDASRPSNLVIMLQYALVYIPAQYIITVIDRPLDAPWLLRGLLLLGLAALTAFSSRAIQIRSGRQITHRLFMTLMIGIYLALAAIIIRTFGLSFQLVGLLDVYDVRADYKDDLESAGGLVGYAVSYLSVLACFAVGYGYIRRALPFLLTGLVTLVYLFGVSGHKSILFSGLLAVGVIYLYARARDRMAQYLIGATAVLIALAAAYDCFGGSILATSIFTRRVIMTPGLLTTYYFDFFGNNETVRLSHSFLSSLSQYPYDLNPPYLIGREYFQRPEMSANANVFADAFSNFGGWGILVFSAILGVILSVLDGLAARKLDGTLVITAAIALPAFSLVNSALFTVMLTHGFLFAMLISLLYSIKAPSQAETPAGLPAVPAFVPVARTPAPEIKRRGLTESR